MIQIVNQDIYTTLSDVLVAPIGLDGTLDDSVAELALSLTYSDDFDLTGYINEAIRRRQLVVGRSLLTQYFPVMQKRIALLPVIHNSTSQIVSLTQFLSGLYDVRAKTQYGTSSMSIPLVPVEGQTSTTVLAGISSVFMGLDRDHMILIHAK